MLNSNTTSCISAVIPLYNRADLISESLDSIANQVHQPSEVIIVDDHSTDNSYQVVEKYKRYSKLNIILIKNNLTKGVSGATNCGINIAKGEFIALLDSDDLWTPSHLLKLHSALIDSPEAYIAFSAIEVFGPAKDTQKKNQDFARSVNICLERAFMKKSLGVWVSDKNLLCTILKYGFPFRCPASLIRKTLFTKFNLSFDHEITYTQDSQFMTLSAYYTPFIYIENIGLKIRRHTENDGDLGYGDKIQKSFKIRIQKLKKFFLNNRISYKEKCALYHRIWLLQVYISQNQVKEKSFVTRAAHSIEIIKNVPNLNGIKSAVKLTLGFNILD